jgi:hypothetical protein
VRRSVTLLIAAAALASCGGDEESVTTTETVTSSQPRSGDCGTQGAYVVKVVNGEVPCETAKSTVSGYDPQGSKVQEVGAYTCEGGEAAVRPLVFTCVAGDNEITASEP